MTVSITIYGETAEDARESMQRLLGNSIPAPAMSGVSVDTIKTTDQPAADPKAPAARNGRRTTPKNVVAENPKPLISTGDERTDTAETTAQDTDDEAGNTTAERVFTIDDVRNAVGGYVNKHGMEAASADLMACFKDATDGKYDRLSALAAAASDVLKTVVEAVDAAAAAVGEDKKPKRYVAKVAV